MTTLLRYQICTAFAALSLACSTDDASSSSVAGTTAATSTSTGTATTGGTWATGGTTSTSTGTATTGGTSATGGTTSTSTGAATTGGASATGGTTSSSTTTGGASATGGTTSSSTTTGGTSATGGTTSTTSSGDCTGPTTGTQGTNPLFTDVYTADPAVMVDNCTFYIACGHDEGSTGFVLNEWYLLKSTDLVNWTRTVAMTLSTFTWADANAWAGQMIKALNGKYYWYVPVRKSSDYSMAIGVAVATSPEGPWTDAIGGPLIDDDKEMSNWGFSTVNDTPYTIDPTVFIDDDGQAYLHYGGFWRMVVAKLNSDMISINGSLTENTPLNYFESPYLIKHDGTYYEIYAAPDNPARIDYSTSSSPTGPWTWVGTILDTMTKLDGEDNPTSHAAVAEFAGNWYIVYHVSNGPNGGTYKRMVAIDKLEFNSDGTINAVTPSAGLSF